MWVFHLDIDAFFCAAEQLRDPSLQGKAVAVQQHQDIISLNAQARTAGVAKHMAPADARRLLRAVGGAVVHVHLAEGGRVSYQPYRQLSARMMQLLRGLPWVAVLEKASIDEAYLLMRQPPGAGRDPCGDDGWGEVPAGVTPDEALRLAHEAKAAGQHALGLCVSVGAAPNRLLAKLASAAAKPDGVRLVAGEAAALQLLSQTPARKLPGYGGKAAEAFERHGIGAATDLQRFTPQQLEQQLGLKPAAAAQLARWCRGADDTPVLERGPAKSLSVQMSLTPQLLPMHPSQGHTVPVAGGAPGVLQPLVVGGEDFKRRVRQLMEAMGLDLLLRVQEDSAEEGGRWPRTLAAALRAVGAGRDQAYTSRSTAFPARTLAAPRAQQQQQQQQEAQQLQLEMQQRRRQQWQQEMQQRPGSEQAQLAGPLEQALVRGLEALIHQAAATYPATATVVELRLTATIFQGAAAAGAAAPITRFFGVVAPGGSDLPAQQLRGVQQEPEQPAEQQLATAAAVHGAAESNAACDGVPLPAQGRQQPGGVEAGPRGSTRGGSADSEGEVDLGGIDVAEQQRILRGIQQQQQQQQPQQQPRRRQMGAAERGRGGGGAKRPRGGPEGGSQPKISAFLRR